VWSFDTLGARRTMSLAGGILARAPFHWSGDMSDLGVLMTEVFAVRMAGGELEDADVTAFGAWLDRIPAPKGVVRDADAVARGQALFNAKEVGCAECHGGSSLTNNAIVDVGTGAKLKVPSLVGVGARAPFLHDGCALTLGDRFGSCGGGDAHGKTQQLSATQLADLVAYLEAL
jgi:mono/diheme cytochrome c family protein